MWGREKEYIGREGGVYKEERKGEEREGKERRRKERKGEKRPWKD